MAIVVTNCSRIQILAETVCFLLSTNAPRESNYSFLLTSYG